MQSLLKRLLQATETKSEALIFKAGKGNQHRLRKGIKKIIHIVYFGIGSHDT